MFTQHLALAVLLVLQTGRLVPESLVEAARANPYTFVHLLSQTGVPAGLELREADRPRRGDFRPQWQPEALAKQELISLDDVLAEFNRAQKIYRAEFVSGVVTIRPSERRTTYLDSRGVTDTIRERGLMNFASRLFAPLSSAIQSPTGGRISVLSSPLGLAIDRGEDVDIELDPTGKTIVQLLNDVVARTAHQAWLIVTADSASPTREAPQVVRFGFIHQYWTTTELPIQSAGTRADASSPH
jgi:hypothetical protein